MIISRDKTIMVIGVPKTGTRSTLKFLSEYGTTLLFTEAGKNPGHHITYTQSCENCESQAPFGVPGFNRANIEKVYIFWRDPVERFISAVNHIRNVRKYRYFLRHKRDWFPGVDFTYFLNPMKGVLGEEFWTAVDIIAKQITPEQIFGDAQILSVEHFRPQGDWYKDIPSDKLFVLDFANFEQNLRIIGNDFGVPADAIVPKINESIKLTTSLSPELEAQVRAYYAEDYKFKPLSTV